MPSSELIDVYSGGFGSPVADPPKRGAFGSPTVLATVFGLEKGELPNKGSTVLHIRCIGLRLCGSWKL